MEDKKKSVKFKDKDNNVFQPLIAKSRDDDISLRGGNIIVYDYNGKRVKLMDAEIWYNNDGDYVEPREYEEKGLCDEICVIS